MNAQWVNVNERLPEYDGSYLVCTGKSRAFVAHFYARHRVFSRYHDRITHWMELPEVPHGGKKDEI